ncbi:hypothetical protein V8G54_029881 [Vigna mungo]|uniref:Uncharacterized protein n=1 Tax=Vigna mungo TaxID=3915 RepID=A0AAQ3MV68_VIGMU
MNIVQGTLNLCLPFQLDWTGYRDPTPPSPPSSIDEYSPGNTQSVPSVPSGGTSSLNGSKRKAPMVDVVDAHFEKLMTSLDEADIYEMLSGMNISDESLLEKCYDFLCGNPTCMKRLMGLSPHKRHSHQMENYATEFYTMNIIVPKIMNFESFPDSGLFFQHHLIFQGVISTNGYLLSEVHKRRIRLNPADWLNIANMKYEGQKLLHEDIFMIWVLKNNIAINWPHHIMQHMLKCKAGDTPLPYGVLITQIMQYCGVHVDSDANTHIGTRHHFSINSLKRLNIVNVSGVCQHNVGDDEEEDQPQHHDNPVQPPPDLSNPNMMTQMWEGCMEQIQVRVQRIEDNLANLSLDMNRQFAHLNQNLSRPSGLQEERFHRLNLRFVQPNSAEFWPSGFVGLGQRRRVPSLDRSVRCLGYRRMILLRTARFGGSWSEKEGLSQRRKFPFQTFRSDMSGSEKVVPSHDRPVIYVWIRYGSEKVVPSQTIRFGRSGSEEVVPSLDRSRRAGPSLDRSVYPGCSVMTLGSLQWSANGACDYYCNVRMVEVYDVCMINMTLERGLTRVVGVVGGPRVDATTRGLYCGNGLALCMVGAITSAQPAPIHSFYVRTCLGVLTGYDDLHASVGDEVPLEQTLETEEDPAPST